METLSTVTSPTAEFSEVRHRAVHFLLGGGFKFKPKPLPVAERCCSCGSSLLHSLSSPRTAADGRRFAAKRFPLSFTQDLIDSDSRFVSGATPKR